MAPGHRCHSGWANLPNQVRACAAPRPVLRTPRHRLDSNPTHQGLLGPQEKDLRHRIQDATHRGPGCSSHPFSHRGAGLTHTRPPTDTPTALPGQVGAQEGSRASIATPGSVHRFFLLTVFSSGILRKPAEARPVPSLALAPSDNGILGAERVGLGPPVCVESSAPNQTVSGEHPHIPAHSTRCSGPC